MKKIIIAAIMLMGMCQNILAQTSESDYSLKGLAQLLVKERFVAYDFINGIAKVHKEQNGKILYGLINKKGEMILPCKYNRIGSFSDGLVAVKDEESRCGFADLEGNIVIPCQYESVGYYSDGLARISKGDSCAYINRDGEIVIPYFLAYEAAPFNNGLAAIEKHKRQTYFIDKQGNVVIPQRDYRCYGVSEGFYIVKSKETSYYGLMDKNGTMVRPMEYSIMGDETGYFNDGLLVVGEYIKSANNKSFLQCGYIATNGYLNIALQYDNARNFSEGFAAVCTNKKWGFINKNRDMIIPCRYDRVQRFSEGLAAVCVNDKWGYVNTNGELIVSCQYERCEDFHEGFAVVRNDNRYAMIDKKGNYYIPFGIYDFISDFSEGLAKVNKRGMSGFVDKNGNSTFDYIK